jgi:hypothetical protein
MPADSLLSIAGMHSSAHATRGCQFATNTTRKVPASSPRDRTSLAESEAITRVRPQSTIQECSRPYAGSNNASRQSMSSSRGGPREQTVASTDDQKARISQQAREEGVFLPWPIRRGGLCNFLRFRRPNAGPSHSRMRRTMRTIGTCGPPTVHFRSRKHGKQ